MTLHIDLLDERVTNCSDFITFPTISNKEHFQGYRGTKGTWDFLSQQFLTIVPDLEDFLKRLKAQKRINPSRHLTIIVEASKHFSKKDIKNVIQLCDKYNVYRSDLFVDLLL